MIRNYQIIEKIGKGTFGIVYKVKKFNDPLIYVIKQISLDGLTDEQINQVYSEAKILSLIKSKYVVKYYESFLEADNLNIVMEYCDNGDLCNYLEEQKKKYKPLKEDLIWKIFIKITLGLATIHKMKILHRDLKTLNIFLKKDMEIKIGDLGVAKELNQASFANTIIGTPYYLSPEMCEDKPYNEKSDIWALGVILYELCTFRHPFTAGNHAALILKIMNANPEPILACYSSNLQKLVNYILEKEIAKRPNCWDLFNLPIITEKAKMLGLYHEIINICSENDYNYKTIYLGNNKNIQPENTMIMDSEDILLQSQLIPGSYKNKTIQVKKINNENDGNMNEKQNINYIGRKNEINFQNNYINNIIQENITDNIQNNYMNNYNNINQIPYNYYENNQPNIINNTNYNNFGFLNGNYNIVNNNNNNYFNNNFNHKNNIIFNNILINNNTINTNDPSLIINNNKKQNFVKVTKVYQNPNNNNNENFFENRSINDINDSLNISVQAVPIDMDRISEKQLINNDESNTKNKFSNYYNYPRNSEMPMDNCIEEEYPKDNTRKQSNKFNLDIIQNMSEKTENNKNEIKINSSDMEKVDNSNQKRKSLTKSNSFIEKDISPIKLINTQESIDIMEHIERLNIGIDNNNNNLENRETNNRLKNEDYNQEIGKGYKYRKKTYNLETNQFKKEIKEKSDQKKEINDKEEIDIKKFNKTGENLSSSHIFNLNIEHQDTVPVRKYLKISNLKNSSLDDDSDSDFNLLKNSQNNDINENNNSEKNKRIEQKIPTIDIDENENDNNFLNEREEINSLENKLRKIDKEIFILLGEKDYSLLFDLYNRIKNKDILFQELEKFIEKNNYTQTKKEKLLDLYLSLISIETKIKEKKMDF